MGWLGIMALMSLILWTVLYYGRTQKIHVLFFGTGNVLLLFSLVIEGYTVKNIWISVLLVALIVVNSCIGIFQNKKRNVSLLSGELVVYMVCGAVMLALLVFGTLILPEAVDILSLR